MVSQAIEKVGSAAFGSLTQVEGSKWTMKKCCSNAPETLQKRCKNYDVLWQTTNDPDSAMTAPSEPSRLRASFGEGWYFSVFRTRTLGYGDVVLPKPWSSLNCGDRWCRLSGPSKSVLKSGSDICNHSRPETSETSATCVANARVQGTEGSSCQ
jgi:hypothetical protein